MKCSFKNFNAMLAITALAASSVYCNPAFSAPTQGTLGATSTGVVNVSVVRTTEVRISGLSDLSLPAYSLGDGNQRLISTVCIYSSTASGSYTVRANGSGTANAYTLSDGASHTLAYSIVWNSAGAGAIGTTGTALATTVTSATLTDASTTSFDCNSGADPTAQLNVNFTGAALDAAPAGTYTGTITMLISPV